ncbi:MAG: 3-dehydroquinate synthase [Ekhidna sp.]|uniref:3-dehydroquinate synthase n=1 Tax=Ekhidna sp. TaxID=2608089 RepID=UPI0032F05240
MSDNLPKYLVLSCDINHDMSAAIEAIRPDKIAVLVDENTKKYCLPHLHIATDIIIEIQSGEQNKTLDTCIKIWEKLTSAGFTRRSLLINLGGGVIGDMGGFAATTFKRGMAFIQVPTTLLSQVDASIGGKLGVDFNGLKNHLGLFQDPARVVVFTEFLETLPKRELRSGFAEIIKHALIRDRQQWDHLRNTPFERFKWDEIIPISIAIKNKVVDEDPREGGVRKILNYGHTIGHALESHFLLSDTPILHGEAVAWGMMLENAIAEKMGILSKEVSDEIKSYLEGIYDFPGDLPSFADLKRHLQQDKKNDEKGVRLSLLDNRGSCTYNVLVEEQILSDVLK